MKYRRRDIFDLETKKVPVSSSDVFVWRQAAHWARIPYHEFAELDGREQSAIVAHYITVKQLDAVLDFVQLQKAKQREANRRGGRMGRPRPRSRS